MAQIFFSCNAKAARLGVHAVMDRAVVEPDAAEETKETAEHG
jgi:hypothetical protein